LAPNGTPVTGTAVAGTLTAGELVINGNDVGIVARDANAQAAAISAADSTVTATATNTQSLSFGNLAVATAGNIQTGADVSGAAIIAGDLTVNGFGITSTGDAAALADAINTAGVGATAVAAANISTTSGAFTALSAGTDYKLTVSTSQGSFDILDITGGTGTGTSAAQMTALLDGSNSTVTDGLAAIGITVSGNAAGWFFNAAGGENITVAETTEVTTEGFQTAAWTGTVVNTLASQTTYSNVVITGDAGSGVAINVDADGQAKTGFADTVQTYSLDISDGTTTTNISFDANNAGNNDGQVTSFEVAAAITADGTYTASVNADTGKIDIAKTVDDGTNMTIAETLTGVTGTGFTDGTYYGSISLDSAADIEITGTSQGLADAGLTSLGNTTTTIDQVNIETRQGATIAISSVDSALAQIDSMRGDLGAVQNRFESTISNLANVSENLSAARSRILDADIAQETSAMTKNNILQQAGVSILAQANQAPQLALSLLG